MFQVDVSLNSDQVKEEVDFLTRTRGREHALPAPPRRRDAALRDREGGGPSGPRAQRSDGVTLLMRWVNAVCAFYAEHVRFSAFVLVQYPSKFRLKPVKLRINSFLTFLREFSVSTLFPRRGISKQVENFTVSFSDGRVLCYLIHHYHPRHVPFDSISQRTTQTVDCAQTGSVVLNSSSESDDSRLDVSPQALRHGQSPSVG